MVKVNTIIKTGFVDLKENKFRYYGDEFETTPERAEELAAKKFVEFDSKNNKVGIEKPQETKKSKKKIDTDI